MRASITSDMFNYSLKPGMAEKLRLFREHGFEYLHWCDDWNNDRLYTREEMSLYRRLVASAGLTCLDVHGTATEEICIDAAGEAAHSAYVKLLGNRVRLCSEFGGDTVVVHTPRRWGDPTEPGAGRCFEAVDWVRGLCLDLGVTLAFENCFPGDERFIAAALDRYGPELAGFCFDSGHANINGNLNRLLNFSSRLRSLHLHDNMGESDSHQPPFRGTVDWPRVVAWIRDSGYEKPLNFEVIHSVEMNGGTMEGFLSETAEAARKVLALLW